MANHSSAKKSLRQSIKRSLINKSRKSKIKTYIKKVLAAVSKGVKDEAKSTFTLAQSEIMKGVSKRILSFNSASRKVRILANKIKNMS